LWSAISLFSYSSTPFRCLMCRPTSSSNFFNNFLCLYSASPTKSFRDSSFSKRRRRQTV